ncbi:MAG TPA: addiction module protein [Thermodesulfovibrionia bacterium]|nr:addiction module protein [Thermodesulfovibrionia bacterium]
MSEPHGLAGLQINNNLKLLRGSIMVIDTIPEIKKLSVSEKWLLFNELWDMLTSDNDILPVSNLHKNILDERQKKHELNPYEGSSWEEIRNKILSRKND